MSIRRRIVARAVIAASVTGLVVVPAVAVIVQALAGHVYGIEILVGALIGTLFFAITGVVTMIYQDSDQLKGAVMGSYALKTALLFGLAMQLDLDGVNRPTLGAVTAASAIAYLIVQTTLITQRNRTGWLFNH